MASAFDAFIRVGPAAFVLKAILVVIAANLFLLSFILLRRTYRKKYFARRDTRLLEFRRNWHALISGVIPFQSWRTNPFDLRIVEATVLDAFEAADREEAARLLEFLRASGLIGKLIFDARQLRGWKRNRALVALGRTRAPEGIPALAEALRDGDLDTRLSAVRALGRNACPEAGDELLNWVAESGLCVPALPFQSALIHCCSERPRMLLPYLQSTDKSTREVLGRVLGEIATPTLGSDLLQFVEDDQAELRAAAARAFACAEGGLATDVLSQLAQDPVWFVRLRAVVSLGKIGHPSGVPALLRCVRDSNRLVRLRAAEALLDSKTDTVPIFEQVVSTRDRYALHAYLTALDNAGLQSKIREAIESDHRLLDATKRALMQVLETGCLVTAEATATEAALARAAAQS